ncbi:hypothetical protein Tco_0348593 [Tanacetum coccineum]
MKRVNTFVDYKTELVEESSKKAETELEENLKKAEAEVMEGSSKRAGTEAIVVECFNKKQKWICLRTAEWIMSTKELRLKRLMKLALLRGKGRIWNTRWKLVMLMHGSQRAEPGLIKFTYLKDGNMQILLLVEKNIILTPATITDMLNKKPSM